MGPSPSAPAAAETTNTPSNTAAAPAPSKPGVTSEAPADPPIRRRRLVIVGPPASGKGTQCELLCARYGGVHISTGDLLRDGVARLAPEHRAAMQRGDLIPDAVVNSLLFKHLEGDECRRRGWLLDGYPRSASQARALYEQGFFDQVDAVIVLLVPQSVLAERVTGRRVDPKTGAVYHIKFAPPPAHDAELCARLVQRGDDTLASLQVRLARYRESMRPILDLARKRGSNRLLLIDANGSAKDVFARIEHALDAVPPLDAPANVASVAAPLRARL